MTFGDEGLQLLECCVCVVIPVECLISILVIPSGALYGMISVVCNAT